MFDKIDDVNTRNQLIDAVRAARIARARADAAEVRALAQLSAQDDGDRSLVDELAPEMRVSTGLVHERLLRSVALVRRLPNVLRLMEAGELEGYGARRLAAATEMLTDETARGVDDLLAERLTNSRTVTSLQPGNLIRRVRRLVEKVDPDGQTHKARRARHDRRARLLHGDDVTSRYEATMQTEVATACFGRVDSIARKLGQRGEELRSLDQLRADVTADLLLGRNPGAEPTEGAAMVFMHMPVDTALCISDYGAELEGYGPIPAAIAREIMTNKHSMWRKVLCDKVTGDPVELGRIRRRPSALIRDLVTARDRECAIPWCHRPARNGNVDRSEISGDRRGPASVADETRRCQRHPLGKRATGRGSDPSDGTTIQQVAT